MKLLEQAQQHLAREEWEELLFNARQLEQFANYKASAANFMGVAHFKLGNLDEAEAYFLKLIAIKPDDAAPINNILTLYMQTNQWQKAAVWAEKLSQMAPNADIFRDLGAIHIASGNFEQAMTTLTRAVALYPNDHHLAFLLFSLQMDSQPCRNWKNIPANLAPDALEPTHAMLFQQLELIHAWYTSNVPILRTILGKLEMTLLTQKRHVEAMMRGEIATTVGTKSLVNVVFSLQGYHLLFAELLNALPPPRDESLPTLWMVGDSHALSPTGQTLVWRGKTYQLDCALAQGIKAWHLARPQNGQMCASFLAQLRATPPDATCLISVGEIDTRVNEGIWPLVQKGKNVDSLIAATFAPAIARIWTEAGGRTLVFAGIPVPHHSRPDLLPEAERQPYLAMLKKANEAIRDAALAHGCDFIDLHALTTANMAWYMERAHLKPLAVPEAFKSHLVTAIPLVARAA